MSTEDNGLIKSILEIAADPRQQAQLKERIVELQALLEEIKKSE